jgi:inner membrane protein
MDPVTQGLLGAVAAQAVLGKQLGHRAWIAGLAGGMLPDADVFLKGISDPALPWELHRHFTHALVMVPVMGLLAALPLLLFRGMRAHKRGVILAATLGALTHGPLDWLTSFGTRILWPFTDAWLAADLFPIIDPLFTIALLIGVIWSARAGTARGARVAWIFVFAYLGVAMLQHGRAVDAQAALAKVRGDVLVRGRVMPQPASLFVYRSVYESDGELVADLVRPGVTSGVTVIPGSQRVALLDVREAPRPREPARLAYVLERFEAFADGYTAYVPGRPAMVGDMRYGIGASFDPLWGVEIGMSPAQPAIAWVGPAGNRREMVSGLLAAIFGSDARFVPLGDVVAKR